MKAHIFSSWLVRENQGGKLTEVIWNALGAGMSAAQAAIILVFAAMRYPLSVAGMISIAYAIANLFMTAAKYGMRHFQVTDLQETFSFRTYLSCRIITVSTALVAAVAFVVYELGTGVYAQEKALLILSIIFLKLVDAAEDVFLGRYQQLGRFLTSAKILSLRQVLTTTAICVLILLGFSPVSAFSTGIVISCVLLVFFLYCSRSIDNASGRHSERDAIFRALKICSPLCLGNTLAIYVGNIPKYAIDAMLDEEIQAIFGYLMLPVFVVTLLNQFIYVPFVKDLGDLWLERRSGSLKRMILRKCGIVLGLSVAVLFAGLVIGLPLLSVIYQLNLTMYKREFAVLLLGGSLYSLAFYLTIPITTIRKQRTIAVGYLTSVLLALSLQKFFVLHYGMVGVAWLYAFTNLILLVFFSIVLTKALR